jgi:hypothetical protein
MTNTEKIKQVYSLYEELQKAIESESNAIKNFSNDTEYTVTRGDKEVSITGQELMEEIRITRTLDGQAGKDLLEINKDTYEALKGTAVAMEEINVFMQKEMDMSFTQMTIVNYMRLTEMIIDMKLEEKGV